jgi:hypothetical protein
MYPPMRHTYKSGSELARPAQARDMVITSYLKVGINGLATRIALPLLLAFSTPAVAQTMASTAGVAGTTPSTQQGAVSLPTIAASSTTSSAVTAVATTNTSAAGASGSPTRKPVPRPEPRLRQHRRRHPIRRRLGCCVRRLARPGRNRLSPEQIYPARLRSSGLGHWSTRLGALPGRSDTDQQLAVQPAPAAGRAKEAAFKGLQGRVTKDGADGRVAANPFLFHRRLVLPGR